MEDHLNAGGASRPAISLDEMIPHDQALEAYPWLTAQILNRWRRERAIRAFKGREGKPVYPKADIVIAITKEMECGDDEQNPSSSSTGANGLGRSPADQATTATGTMTEADALSEKLFLQEISSKRKKSSSGSSGTVSQIKGRHPKSTSSAY